MNDDNSNPTTAITIPKKFPWLCEIEVAALFPTGDCLAGVVGEVVEGVVGEGFEGEAEAPGGLLGLLAVAA